MIELFDGRFFLTVLNIVPEGTIDVVYTVDSAYGFIGASSLIDYYEEILKYCVIVVVYLLYEFSIWVCRVKTLYMKSWNELPWLDGILFIVGAFIDIVSEGLVVKLRLVKESHELEHDEKCGAEGEDEGRAPATARAIANLSFVA